MRIRALLVAAFPLASAQSVMAQQSAVTPPPVEQMMTPSELAATGVTKLTETERNALNQWLAKYTAVVLQVAAMQGQQPGGDALPLSGAVVESRIDGTFNGWDGETVFKLQNGQVWQQASYAYMYHYAYAPRVLIYRSGAGFKMKVDGVTNEIAVRRLR